MIAIEKDPGRDLRVLNLTDPHLDGSYLRADSPDRDFLFATIRTLVERSSPDLITVSGDLDFGDNDDYLDVCRLFAEHICGYGVPWALAWGNHDNQGGESVILRAAGLFSSFPGFLYEAGEKELGNGNYVIAVRENGGTVFGIIMMDSHDRVPYVKPDGERVSAWAKLLPEQLVWYERQIAALRASGCENTALILHIPIYAYRQAFAAAFRAGRDPKSVSVRESYEGGVWNAGYEDSFGVQRENVCSYPEDDGAFGAIEKLGSTKLVLCGHDHVNCWGINWRGVRLMYSLKTGRGCYFDKEMNGGTLLTVSSSGSAAASHLFV